MLSSYRSIGLDDARASVSRLLHPAFCVRVTEVDGATLDEGLFVPRIGRGLKQGRARLTVVLSGRAQVRSGAGAWELRRASMLLQPQLDSFVWRIEPNARLLTFDVETKLLTAPCVSAEVGTSSRPEAFDGVARAVRGGDASCSASAAAELVRLVRAEGVALDSLTDLDTVDEEGAGFAPIARAMDRVLSRLDSSPMTVDLVSELGCSRRTIARQVDAYHAHFGLQGVGARDWRSALRYWRLASACILMTSAHATTERVADAVGFSGPEALCHALAKVELPSPQRVRSLALRADAA